MSEFLINQKNKRTFQDIIFDHLNRILEITKFEFTGGYTNVSMNGNMAMQSYVGDKKEEYCQLVEALSDIMYPRFKEPMKKFYEGIKDDKKTIDDSYVQRLDKAYKEHHDEHGEPKSTDEYKKYSRKRLKLTRELFRQLNMDLKANSYYGTKLQGYSDATQSMTEVDVDGIVDTDNPQ